MPVTLTIKQVPEPIARKLRERAAASHRSLQGELMAILHDATAEPPRAREPEAVAPYTHKPPARGRKIAAHGRRLTLRELWERSRQLGGVSESESTEIVRDLRDARHRR